MAKPTNLGIWATGGGAAITEPLLAEKQLGWEVSKKPPAQWMNWWQNIMHLWIVWLDAFESTVHTWTALQTFNAGILAPAFGSTSGVRGTSAITNVAAVLGTATTGTAAGVKGTTSSNTGYGGHFSNTGTGGGATGLFASGRYGGTFVGTYWAGVTGELSAGTVDASAAGGRFVSSVSGRPGVRGEGNESSGAWGGEFLGADSGESSEPGGRGIFFKGGNSSITDASINAGDGMNGQAGDATGDGSFGQSGSGGTNTLRGGHVDGLLNDEGLPGIGLTLTGGSITDDANGRVGATALKLIAGDGAGGRGLSFDADGDAQIDGTIALIGGAPSGSDPQIDKVTAGNIIKASLRIDWAGGVGTIRQSFNVASISNIDLANGVFGINFAADIPIISRFAIAYSQKPVGSCSVDFGSGSDAQAVIVVLDASGGNRNLTSSSVTVDVLFLGPQ